ncbi:MAG: aminotransferase class I/II-fold pyridoxal phosphate-dependent enzyme [Bacteroides sp.]|nr:aminotransferase class I/II-fold pyridoxal phosphate-dependent enzyme [Bacillota bacterium]MCM1393617.1 aminotransferase class I/II-fold pyridoxal phosphate-dependent enzyme [[Eubacterium] siraeum]MCM1455508.1 aminotransferase class I/II-fold pyridoxal phosphate-dependent enzyme [Bacteroides sp.]
MNKYQHLTSQQLQSAFEKELARYKELQGKGVNVDMTRGRPSKEQLEIAMPMLKDAGNCNYIANGLDARNYGEPAGTASARKLFADLLEVDSDNVIVFDGSSLDIMYNLVQFAMQFGIMGATPWNKLDCVKFLCPSPGYDRHFSICQHFGIKMITVPMLDDGPDMDIVEKLVGADESIKGMWCVPKYSNPTGIVYGDDTVIRIANLKPLAKDFRVFWDNAYIIHGLYGNDDNLLNIFDVAKKAGNEDMIYELASTSKITFAGSGVAALAASKANVDDVLKKTFFKQINPNKVNQVMHVAFLKDVDNIKRIMAMHAEILRPKFELCDRMLGEEFGDCDGVKWSKPRGGYFISLDVPHSAKRVVELAMGAGVKFTAAGSTYPYKQDPNDHNIRIAPSVPSLDELKFALEVLICSIKLDILENFIKKKQVNS